MNILVTGSAGFIGYHLTNMLLNKGYIVLGIDSLNNYYDVNLKKDRLNILKKHKNFTFKKIDITNENDLQNIFQSFKPKKVINLAAQPGVQYSFKKPYSYIDSNIYGFFNIIENCKKHEVEGLIYASSSSVYGNNKKIPFDINDDVSKPASLYGATKRANELLAYTYSNLFEINTTALRFFTVYGSYYRPDMAINIFTDKIIKEQPISVFNHGKMRRDFTHIDDIVKGTLAAIEKNYKNEVFNLGNSKSESLTDVISLIESEVGKKAIINYMPIQPGDVKKTYADIDYSRKKLNYSPKISIKEGIPSFVKWFKEYYHV